MDSFVKCRTIMYNSVYVIGMLTKYIHVNIWHYNQVTITKHNEMYLTFRLIILNDTCT